jgi:sugar lactone lactonase YvrE
MDCGLGEAPFYEEATHHLRFVDIVKKKLHIVDLATGPSSLVTLDLKDAVR